MNDTDLVTKNDLVNKKERAPEYGLFSNSATGVSASGNLEGKTLKQWMDENGSGRTLTEIVTEAAENHLTAWFVRFYPRRYNNIGQYSSPKLIAAYFTHAMWEAHKMGIHNAGTAIRLMLPGLISMITMKMPNFFLSPGLLDAIKQTDYKDPIDWMALKLPFEHGVIILPKGAVTHPVDGYVSHIMWSRLTKMVYPMMGNIPNIEITRDSFCFVALCPETGTWYDSNITAEFRETLTLNNIFYRPKHGEPSLMDGDLPLSAPTDQKLKSEDAPFLELLAVILFGTLLAMNCRPELVEMGRRETLAKKRDGTALEYWSPNIIGGRYQVKRVPGKGIHASPVWHWRRGFYRNQVCGPGLRDRRVMWIEPTMVNYKDENESKHS